MAKTFILVAVEHETDAVEIAKEIEEANLGLPIDSITAAVVRPGGLVVPPGQVTFSLQTTDSAFERLGGMKDGFPHLKDES